MTRRRKHRPVSVERDAALWALGIDPADVEWHHEPPLAMRPIDPATGLYAPDENDPRHIIPMARVDHRARTPKDVSAVAKVKRVTRRHDEFRQRLLAKDAGRKAPETKPKRKIHSRPWPKKRRD